MNVNKFLHKILLIEILKGMALTIKMFVSKPVTRHYPEEPRPAMPGFRGMHALVREESTGLEKCIACGLCGAICPAQCIKIQTAEGPENRKVAERYEIDMLRCIYCGFCVEACPVGAVVLTEHYEYADYSREALYATKEKLLENWDTHMAGDKGKEYFKRFWHPTADDYASYEGQAMFRGTKQEGPSGEGEADAS